jgi:hypothetical protein
MGMCVCVCGFVVVVVVGGGAHTGMRTLGGWLHEPTDAQMLLDGIAGTQDATSASSLHMACRVCEV